MTPRFIPGAVYESKTHGLVEFKGIDRYMGQASLRFFSVDHDQTCYWLPSALDLHFGAAQETGRVDAEIRCTCQDFPGAIGFCMVHPTANRRNDHAQ